MEEAIVHKTKVKIDLIGLEKTLNELKEDYLKIGHRDNHEGRSRFSKWNNINHTYKRILSGEYPSELDVNTGFALITITGASKGNSSRVYYTPSITSLSKPFRKHIIPVNDDSVFVFFDLSAAEFFMNCVFSGETEAILAYQNGEDIYKTYSHIFPKGTKRDVYKEALIGNMYGLTGYTLSARMRQSGIAITQTQAERLLNIVAAHLIKMTNRKKDVIVRALRTRKYQCPNGFNMSDLVTISVPKDGEDVNSLLALSTFVQSALGLFMQSLIKDLDPRCKGTLITVFDSVLCEVKKESIDRYKNWAKKRIAPFKAGSFNVASTFYDAQEGIK